MANNFKSGMASGVGTSYVAVYSTPTAKKSILIELDIANTTASGVTVSVGIGDGPATTSPTYFIVKNAIVPSGDSLQVVSGQKIILDGSSTQKKVFVSSSVAGSVDVICSILEDVA